MTEPTAQTYRQRANEARAEAAAAPSTESKRHWGEINATTLAQVSTWADEIRPQRRETAPWHFVDIPINPPAETPAGL